MLGTFMDFTLDRQEEVRCRKRFRVIIKKIRNKTHFTLEELEAILIVHYKLTKKQVMDRKYFRKIMYELLDMQNDILIDRIFSAFDKSNKLYITMESWVLGMSVFLRGTLTERIQFCFAVYNMMGDGFIKKEHMFQAMRHSVQSTSPDEDSDEIVKEMIESITKKMDQDRDGMISLEDYRNSVFANPLLLEFLGPCLPYRAAVYAFLTTLTQHVSTMHFRFFQHAPKRRRTFKVMSK